MFRLRIFFQFEGIRVKTDTSNTRPFRGEYRAGPGSKQTTRHGGRICVGMCASRRTVKALMCAFPSFLWSPLSSHVEGTWIASMALTSKRLADARQAPMCRCH